MGIRLNLRNMHSIHRKWPQRLALFGLCLLVWNCCLVDTIFAAEPLYLVVGSFSTRDQAEREVLRLESLFGHELNVMPNKAATLFRIVDGPWELPSANEQRANARRMGLSGAWLMKSGESVQAQGERPVSAATPSHPQKSRSPVVGSMPGKITGSAGTSAITLPRAIEIALRRNLDLKAGDQRLIADDARVREVGAALRPQLVVGIQQTALDQDRAKASFGLAPQYRTTASLQVRQVLFSDELRAAVQIQEYLRSAAAEGQRILVLDTILKVGRQYLQLLRARTFEMILMEDLNLTDSNFQRAETRLKLGVASRSEVYRWETVRAKSRKALVLAKAGVRKAEIGLNLLLNRGLEDPLETQLPSVEDSYLLIADPGVWNRLQDESSEAGFKNFWLAEAVQHSPELAALRNQQQARRRELSAARRSLLLPKLEIVAEGAKYLTEKGSGVDSPDFKIPGFDSGLDLTTDRVQWNAAIRASLPLFAGGRRYGRIQRVGALLSETDIQFDNALLKLQAGVLSGVADVLASLKNIELSRDAARAGRNNLRLVTDSFERGVVTNIDLLDARNAALSSDLAAANTTFDFLIDYLDLQRSLGQFDLVSTPEQLEQMRQRMENFF